MSNTFQHLTRFFESFISLNFWRRLVGWRRIREMSYEAFEESKLLMRLLEKSSSEADQERSRVGSLAAENEHLRNSQADLAAELRSTIARQSAEITQLKDRLEQQTNRNAILREENVALKQTEESRRTGHDRGIATLAAIQERIQNERRSEQEQRDEERLERQKQMLEQWSRHQTEVGEILKTICRKHAIEYVQTVPFKGNPDNTIRICDEFVVFDAKSPGREDLRNFPQYVKVQAEAVQKYANQENVRKEIFLVIPSNTVHVVGQYCYNMADYSVFVVTPSALEPIVLSLKKLEDYEFVNQLSPEERENICRLIGKFAHVAKRRIQVDHFFAWEFLDILTRCESGLPREMLQRIVEFEKAEKLNPPQERRSKHILTKELENDARKIEKEAEARSVTLPPTLPLFEKEAR